MPTHHAMRPLWGSSSTGKKSYRNSVVWSGQWIVLTNSMVVKPKGSALPTPWRWRHYSPLKYSDLLTQSQYLTSQKTQIFINITVRSTCLASIRRLSSCPQSGSFSHKFLFQHFVLSPFLPFWLHADSNVASHIFWL